MAFVLNGLSSCSRMPVILQPPQPLGIPGRWIWLLDANLAVRSRGGRSWAVGSKPRHCRNEQFHPAVKDLVPPPVILVPRRGHFNHFTIGYKISPAPRRTLAARPAAAVSFAQPTRPSSSTSPTSLPPRPPSSRALSSRSLFPSQGYTTAAAGKMQQRVPP